MLAWHMREYHTNHFTSGPQYFYLPGVVHKSKYHIPIHLTNQLQYFYVHCWYGTRELNTTYLFISLIDYNAFIYVAGVAHKS